MMAIAGMQYQNMPQRLCNAYLLDDQTTTGIALVVASVVIAGAWCWRLAPAIADRRRTAAEGAAVTEAG
jgi:hypothetical protein